MYRVIPGYHVIPRSAEESRRELGHTRFLGGSRNDHFLLGKAPFDLFAKRRFQGVCRLVFVIVASPGELFKQPLPTAEQSVDRSISQHEAQIRQVDRSLERSFRRLRFEASETMEIMAFPLETMRKLEASVGFARQGSEDVVVRRLGSSRRGVYDRFGSNRLSGGQVRRNRR